MPPLLCLQVDVHLTSLRLTLLSILAVLSTVLFVSPARAQEADSLTLPVFHLAVANEHLEQLDAHPTSNTMYPAVVTADGETYDCEVRYRGGTSRTLPKKSWRIEFENDDNPFGAEKVNLRAEYRERSLMRNHLVHRLFEYHGYAAPETRHVSLFLNDRYVGVYLQAERVDEDFLERHGREMGSLYKLGFHAGVLAPALFADAYPKGWEAKGSTTSDTRPVQQLISKVAFWNPDDFARHVDELFDVDNVLFYYAVQIAVINFDGFTQNHYVHHNPDTGLYEFIPWDMDASLGNRWPGEYDPNRVQHDPARRLFSTLFQRLMEYDEWQRALHQKLDEIAQYGFPHLVGELGPTYARIRNDVYLDPEKQGTNEDFETAVAQLRTFLIERPKYVRSWKGYARTRLGEFAVSNPFPTEDDLEVTVNVRMEQQQSPEARLVWDIDYNEYTIDYRWQQTRLHDDGLHDDGAAGDGLYGARIDLSSRLGQLIPLGIVNDNTFYPSAASDYAFFHPTAFYALNASGNTQEQYERVRIGQVHGGAENVYVPLVNPNADTLDLSYCFFQAGAYYQKLPLPPGTRVGGGDTLVVTTNADAARARFPGKPVVSGLFFDVAPGDTARLLSPVHTVLAEQTVKGKIMLDPPFRVIINEINYNAPDNLDTEDWVELYNTEPQTVDLSGWAFMDAEDDHRFVFPEGTMIAPSGFILVSRDTAAFRLAHPDIEPLFGDMGFGFSGSGERLRLYSDLGELVDEVTYDDEAPWPPEANGEGPTLELIDADEDNALSQFWVASRLNGGTPSDTNTVSTDMEEPPAPAHALLEPSHPNPFYGHTTITYRIEQNGHVALNVYDVLGRRVRQLVDAPMPSGPHAARLDGDGLAPGTYYFVLVVDGRVVDSSQAVRLR